MGFAGEQCSTSHAHLLPSHTKKKQNCFPPSSAFPYLCLSPSILALLHLSETTTPPIWALSWGKTRSSICSRSLLASRLRARCRRGKKVPQSHISVEGQSPAQRSKLPSRSPVSSCRTPVLCSAPLTWDLGLQLFTVANCESSLRECPDHLENDAICFLVSGHRAMSRSCFQAFLCNRRARSTGGCSLCFRRKAVSHFKAF